MEVCSNNFLKPDNANQPKDGCFFGDLADFGVGLAISFCELLCIFVTYGHIQICILTFRNLHTLPVRMLEHSWNRLQRVRSK